MANFDRAERLRIARETAGFKTAAAAAASMGMNAATYSNNENGGRGISADAAVRYASKFKVSLRWLLTGQGEMRGGDDAPPVRQTDAGQMRAAPVVGYVQAWFWQEVDENQDVILERIPVIEDPRFKRAEYVAYKVRGDSFDEFVKDGGYVIAVPWSKTFMDARDGLPVVVEQVRDGGALRQRTLKEISVENGETLLIPRSTNPNHKPIALTAKDAPRQRHQ